MAYPKFKNKHLAEAVSNPEDLYRYKRVLGKHIPKDFVLVYDRKLLARILRRYRPARLGRLVTGARLFEHKGVGIAKMNGIGSPHAVFVLEGLIALGAKRFLNIGTAGGLGKLGIYLCQKAMRDEGTSYHYMPQGRYSFPDPDLTAQLGTSMRNSGLGFEKGVTWTIDAPYRETRDEVGHFRKLGLVTVEMEASALFAVAKVRKVRIASAFVVSDVLGDKWEPKFHLSTMKKNLDRLFEAALHCLESDG